jgi:hypothetical protein
MEKRQQQESCNIMQHATADRRTTAARAIYLPETPYHPPASTAHPIEHSNPSARRQIQKEEGGEQETASTPQNQQKGKCKAHRATAHTHREILGSSCAANRARPRAACEVFISIPFIRLPRFRVNIQAAAAREKPRPSVMGVSQHSMREKKREYNLGNMRKEGAREACVCTTAKAACCSCNCAWSSGPGLFILFFAQSLSFHVFVCLPAWSWLPCLFDSISRLHDATRDSEPRCVNNPSLPRGLGLLRGGVNEWVWMLRVTCRVMYSKWLV